MLSVFSPQVFLPGYSGGGEVELPICRITAQYYGEFRLLPGAKQVLWEHRNSELSPEVSTTFPRERVTEALTGLGVDPLHGVLLAAEVEELVLEELSPTIEWLEAWRNAPPSAKQAREKFSLVRRKYQRKFALKATATTVVKVPVPKPLS